MDASVDRLTSEVEPIEDLGSNRQTLRQAACMQMSICLLKFSALEAKSNISSNSFSSLQGLREKESATSHWSPPPASETHRQLEAGLPKGGHKLSAESLMTGQLSHTRGIFLTGEILECAVYKLAVGAIRPANPVMSTMSTTPSSPSSQ